MYYLYHTFTRAVKKQHGVSGNLNYNASTLLLGLKPDVRDASKSG